MNVRHEFYKHAPMGTLDGSCYFCRSKTPYMYKGVRLCSKHADDDVKAIIDVQNVHVPEESKQLRDIMNQ